MKQVIQSRWALASLAALFFAMFALVGCGEDKKPGGGGTSAKSGGGGAAPGGGESDGEQAAGGEGKAGDSSISGKVTLKGDAPKNAVIDMSAHPDCQKQHEGKVTEEKWVVGEGNGLRWVFVYVQKGDEVVGKKWPKPTESVTLDQKGCHYIPHVFGLYPGQDITIKNSDPVMHNIHAQPTKSGEFNESQQPQGQDLHKTIDKSEVLVAIKCDVHSWMHSYAGVVAHPYWAVTDEKGAFAIEKLPAGKYTIRAMHESGKKVEKEIEVKAGEKATLDFEIEPK